MKIILHTFFILFLSLTLNAQISDNSVETIASGLGSVAMGYQTEATAAFSTAMGIQSKATGPRSTAIGWLTQAQEYQSTAMGYNSTASGNTSTAMGRFTTASGSGSTAMGGYSIASGNYSTAIGDGTIASDHASLAIGYYNLSGSNPTNDGSYSPSAVAFAIGNGTSSLDEDFFPVYNRSDALTVLFDGTTTVAGSITAPAFIGDGSQLTNLPSSGANSPFSYNSNEAGGIEVADYTTASGSSAFAVGNDNLASGSSSTAMGRGTIASGNDSTALGANTEASGIASTAMGERTTASGDFSTAMGRDAVASNQDSTAMGNKTIASGVGSTAMGFGTIASGDFSTAIGDYTLSSGDFSTAMGKGTMASGGYSTAMGFFTTAEDYMTLALGAFNKADETPNPDNFSYQNTAFVIGNGGYNSDGAYDGHLSNAFEVLFDGTTTIAGDLNVNSDKKVFFGNQSFIEGATEGTVLILNADNNILFQPGGTSTVNFEPNGDAIFNGDVKVTSDKRLKSNIISLGSTLTKLLQIDGKSYTMKKDESEKQKIGLLAQDIEKVFPELVSESNGIKSVNYQGLVPVLINALKEQQSEIDELKTMLKAIIEKT